MSEKAISVSLAKIDYDCGEPYIHLIASAPYDFVFSGLKITVCTPEKQDTHWSIIDDSELIGKKHIHTRIQLSNLFDKNNYTPSIFKLILSAEPCGEDNVTEEVEPRHLWLSDVHGIYKYFIDELMNTNKCTEISNDMIQKYLLLYGHQQALSEYDFSTAMEFFALMHKGFSKCGNYNKLESNCGCYDRR